MHLLSLLPPPIWSSDCIVLVLDYAARGTLYDVLRDEQRAELSGASGFSEKKARQFTAEILTAVHSLHKHNILHRDIKLENILVGDDGHIYVSGFGLCQPHFGGIERAMTGTPSYMAPEIIAHQSYGRAVDYWCVGVLLYEMLTGTQPWQASTVSEIYASIAGSSPDMERLESSRLSPAVIDLVKGLLTKSPSKRIGADRARVHPFFSSAGFDWDSVKDRLRPARWATAVRLMPQASLSQNQREDMHLTDKGPGHIGLKNGAEVSSSESIARELDTQLRERLARARAKAEHEVGAKHGHVGLHVQVQALAGILGACGGYHASSGQP